MGLRVTFQGGPRAGQIVNFDDAVEVITIGRDPQKCQVVFPPDQTRVGREHVALKRVLGRYRFVINGNNLVLLDGQPVMDDQELHDNADLQLGRDGPILVVERTGAAGLMPTVMEGERPRGKATIIRDAERSAKSGKKFALIAVALIAVASIIGFAMLHSTSTDVEKVRQDQATLATGITDKFSAIQANVDSRKPMLQEALNKAAPSVYLVLRRDPDNTDVRIATAWVVDNKGTKALATNVHVAEEFKALTEGQSLIVRSDAQEPKDFKVSAVKLHPGATWFQKVWEGYQPVYGSAMDNAEVVENAGLACDVAVMTVETTEGLAEPLKLASDDELRKLDSGDPVGFVGYPMEGMALGGVNVVKPTPTVQFGHITSVTDYFGVKSPDGSGGYLVQHAISSAGGASGSPILNEKGEVVAILSGGNVIGQTDYGRIGSSSNVNFAQRVDLLKELIEDTADSKQESRTADWKKSIQSLYNSGAVITRKAAVAQAQEKWCAALASAADDQFDYTAKSEQNVVKGQLKAPAKEGDPATDHVDVNLSGAGPFMVLVVSNDRSKIDVALSTGAARSMQEGTRLDLSEWACVVPLESKRKVSVGLDIQGTSKDVEYEVHVFGADPKPVSVEVRHQRMIDNWLDWLGGQLKVKVASETVLETKETLKPPAKPGDSNFGFTDVTLNKTGHYIIVAYADGVQKLGIVVAEPAEQGGQFTKLAESQDLVSMPYVDLETTTEKKAIRVYVVGDKPGITYDVQVYLGVQAP